MERINVLSKITANQIAAGEVIERPASVVKELLENAIDAGAASITVETRGGGLEYIRVCDDGCGIHRDDAELAFLPHATSKISTSADLSHIDTLGFRGEALASIAAVSKVRLMTKRPQDETGTELRLQGGEEVERREAGCPDGTTLEISDIFYNMPARLKFLKNPRTEGAYISDYISRMILAAPHIAIKLIQNGRVVYKSSGNGSLVDALFCLYGGDILPDLDEISCDDGYMKLYGYVGNERIARLNRNQQTFLVNGRYIKSQKLSFAVQRAFNARLMQGRFPFVVLCITVASSDIDVNVHPNKLDIRFKDESRVLHTVASAVRAALAPNVPDMMLPPVQLQQPACDSDKQADISQTAENGQDPAQYEAELRGFGRSVDEPVVYAREAAQSSTYTRIPYSARRESIAPTVARHVETQLTLETGEYHIIGQLFACYWVVQQGEYVYFIDQHAAHERQLYEKLKNSVKADSQLLLLPQIVKLTPQEYDVLFDNLPFFVELGFDIESFGSLCVNIRAIPYMLGEPQTEACLHDALALLIKTGRVSAADIKRAALIQASCKYAVKAGNMLSGAEVEELLRAYADADAPLTCPHGRPIMIRLSQTEFEKQFKRTV